MSVYDISATDPADILGNDLITQNELEQCNIGNSNPSGTTTEFGVDSKLEAVSRELKKHQRRRRSLQISGDSFNGSTSRIATGNPGNPFSESPGRFSAPDSPRNRI